MISLSKTTGYKIYFAKDVKVSVYFKTDGMYKLIYILLTLRAKY